MFQITNFRLWKLTHILDLIILTLRSHERFFVREENHMDLKRKI